MSDAEGTTMNVFYWLLPYLESIRHCLGGFWPYW